jgi:hypothetical protein
MDLLPYLLPPGASFRVAGLVIDAEAHELIVEVDAIAAGCPCPSCHHLAERVHSHYWRSVVDLPWAVLLVHLHLHVRKSFCDNQACPRKIFTERLPNLVAPSAKRTLRLVQQQQLLGLALGGNPSARVSAELDRGASRNTFLRLVRRLPLPEPEAPEVGEVVNRVQRHRMHADQHFVRRQPYWIHDMTAAPDQRHIPPLHTLQVQVSIGARACVETKACSLLLGAALGAEDTPHTRQLVLIACWPRLHRALHGPNVETARRRRAYQDCSLSTVIPIP